MDLLQVCGAALFTASNLPLISGFRIRRLKILDPAATYAEEEMIMHQNGLNARTSPGLENHLFIRPPVPMERSPLRQPAAKAVKPVGQLRCERCNGRRSPAYHRRQYMDPATYPSVGICSRRQTCCAAAKAAIQPDDNRQPISELPAYELTWNSTPFVISDTKE